MKTFGFTPYCFLDSQAPFNWGARAPQRIARLCSARLRLASRELLSPPVKALSGVKIVEVMAMSDGNLRVSVVPWGPDQATVAAVLQAMFEYRSVQEYLRETRHRMLSFKLAEADTKRAARCHRKTTGLRSTTIRTIGRFWSTGVSIN